MGGPLTGYEAESIVEVEAVLDDSPADADEVYQRTIGHSERAIAAVAAKRAGSGGGGGGSTPVAANLALDSDIDIHASGNFLLKWDNLVDNEWDYDTIGALPAGLGLDASFDGSNANITTTESGIWTFTGALVLVTGADASIRGYVTLPFAGFATPFGPVDSEISLSICQAFNLPSGATSQMGVTVTADASANPYLVHGDLCIVRLA
jgi:hypothetical protein